VALIAWFACTCGYHGFAQQAPFVERAADAGEYTKGIEGPAVGPDGSLYVVNLRENGTIGMVKFGTATSELFAKLPSGSIGNGIRFDHSGRMYVADYKNTMCSYLSLARKRPQCLLSLGTIQPAQRLDGGSQCTILRQRP